VVNEGRWGEACEGLMRNDPIELIAFYISFPFTHHNFTLGTVATTQFGSINANNLLIMLLQLHPDRKHHW
jgi:hypothetical protein